MRIDRFLLGSLFVWRVTHLISAEDGPWDIVVRLRQNTGEGFFGQLLDCFYCLSIWVSAPLAVLLTKKFSERILWWPALSAGAILLERISDRGYNEPSSLFFEDSEN